MEDESKPLEDKKSDDGSDDSLIIAQKQLQEQY